MTPGETSQTAQLTTVMRANHFLFAPEPKILKDSLALPLSGLETPEAITAQIAAITDGFTKLSDPETAADFVKITEHSVCMRSRLVEGRIGLLRNQGLKQVIFLGAGMDTTAYRGGDMLEGLQIIEVDHPDTQKWKKHRLKECAIAIPPNLKFVDFDFERQTLGEALHQGGVDDQLQALFPWLGVHMYLTDEAVKSTLQVMASFPGGSELVMDFIMPDYANGNDLIPDPIAQLSKVVTEMGEPLLSQYSEADLKDRMIDAGFGEVKFYTTNELVRDYLGGHGYTYDMPEDAIYLASAII